MYVHKTKGPKRTFNSLIVSNGTEIDILGVLPWGAGWRHSFCVINTALLLLSNRAVVCLVEPDKRYYRSSWVSLSDISSVLLIFLTSFGSITGANLIMQIGHHIAIKVIKSLFLRNDMKVFSYEET